MTRRDAATVEITPATVSVTSVLARSRRAVGPLIAAAALAVLLAAIGGALLLGRPERIDTGSSASVSTPSAPTPPSPGPQPEPPSHAIVAPPATVLAPAAGQPCDSTVESSIVDDEGTLLECTLADGGSTNWIPALTVDRPQHGNSQQSKDNSGNGKPGHGNGKRKNPHK